MTPSLGYEVFDSDQHYYEPTDCFSRYIPKKQLAKAIHVTESKEGKTDIWIVEVGTGGMRPLTSSGDASAPVWTPDGARVTFASGSIGSFAIQGTRADGSGPVETLLESEYRVWPEAWHADGGQLVFLSPVT